MSELNNTVGYKVIVHNVGTPGNDGDLGFQIEFWTMPEQGHLKVFGLTDHINCGITKSYDQSSVITTRGIPAHQVLRLKYVTYAGGPEGEIQDHDIVFGNNNTCEIKLSVFGVNKTYLETNMYNS